MKRIFIFLLIGTLLFNFVACGNTEPQKEDEKDPPAKEEVSLTLLDNNKSEYSIIRADNESKAVVKSVSTIIKKLMAVTGYMFELGTDWTKEEVETVNTDSEEILIGETNRAETAEVLASLPENSYTVAIKNNKLVIVGTDDNMTVFALRDFDERILNNPELCSDGRLTVSEKDCFTVTVDSKIGLKEMIEEGYNYVATVETVIKCKPEGQYSVGQGTASDGTYVYFAMRNRDDSGAVISKYRLDDGSFVAKSDVLDLGHANDMTYDFAKNRLVVAHGQSEGKILTIVYPETLEFVEDIKITHGSGAITYCVERGLFAISQGGKTLHIMDGDLKHIVSYSRTPASGYTAQGMGSDENYVFFPMSGSSDNILEVYDWDGNYVTRITVETVKESESLFYINGEYYVSFNSSGSELCRLEFCIVYE